MRLLYLTDTHIRNNNPKNRIDNFPESLKVKLQEVIQLTNDLEIDYLLHGGDLFDVPWPPAESAKLAINFLEQVEVPMYVVSGNHDLVGQKLSTLDDTLLGYLAQRGLFRLLTPGDKVYLKKANFTLQLSGQHYYGNIDRNNQLRDYCVKKENCDVAVHMVHGMLLPKAFSPKVPATLIDQVGPRTEADFTLCGHAHLGYPTNEINGRYFINPGSISRMFALEREVIRTPQVVLLDFSGGKLDYQYIALKSARPGEEVLRF
ncbi:metallophosphoesterase family protein [Desulfolucanica intricata]|uniref:metallophosphoesterase family protein n=1 Tax=Desulfolucanica intricata TaxID=1285191 RepID=UPI00082E9177|nr:metallophosphoesterase family protein [Desulfolucanica intricata]